MKDCWLDRLGTLPGVETNVELKKHLWCSHDDSPCFINSNSIDSIHNQCRHLKERNANDVTIIYKQVYCQHPLVSQNRQEGSINPFCRDTESQIQMWELQWKFSFKEQLCPSFEGNPLWYEYRFGLRWRHRKLGESLSYCDIHSRDFVKCSQWGSKASSVFFLRKQV